MVHLKGFSPERTRIIIENIEFFCVYNFEELILKREYQIEM